MRRTTTILLAALALVAAGCGGDDGGGESSADAMKLLERGFAGDVDTGRLDMEMEVELEGVPQAQGPFRLELDGPFRSRGTAQIPDIDMQFVASGLGLEFDGRVVSLPETRGSSTGTRPTRSAPISGAARSDPCAPSRDPTPSPRRASIRSTGWTTPRPTARGRSPASAPRR